MDWVWPSSEVYVMEVFILGAMLGFIVGYPMGLFIDKIDKRERAKNGR